MKKKFYKKKKFWAAILGVLVAARVIGSSQSDAIMKIIKIVLGG